MGGLSWWEAWDFGHPQNSELAHIPFNLSIIIIMCRTILYFSNDCTHQFSIVKMQHNGTQIFKNFPGRGTLPDPLLHQILGPTCPIQLNTIIIIVSNNNSVVDLLLFLHPISGTLFCLLSLGLVGPCLLFDIYSRPISIRITHHEPSFNVHNWFLVFRTLA